MNVSAIRDIEAGEEVLLSVSCSHSLSALTYLLNCLRSASMLLGSTRATPMTVHVLSEWQVWLPALPFDLNRH